MRTRQRSAWSLASPLPWCVGLVLLGATAARAELLPCRGDGNPQLVAEALATIRQSVDPCHESAEIHSVFETLERCSQATQRICLDVTASRNAFERTDQHTLSGTITWNPELRSEIEGHCDGSLGEPVRRDPVASLLHELVHAAQDCQGLNPGEHELEAVRIENIYRRAAGLCQRHGYGDELLPVEMVRLCTAEQCSCSPPAHRHHLPGKTHIAAPHLHPTISSGDAQLQSPDSFATPW